MEKAWLREELQRLQSCPLNHDKALTLQERIKRYADCWLVFLDDPRVPPTNNHAERCLRPLVILRKITFGHRTRSGATTMARLMTIQETAKRHGRGGSTFSIDSPCSPGSFPTPCCDTSMPAPAWPDPRREHALPPSASGAFGCAHKPMAAMRVRRRTSAVCRIPRRAAR